MLDHDDSNAPHVAKRRCIEALFRLTEELPHLIVSAKINADGTLGPVDGLDKKIRAALEPEHMSHIHAVGFHTDQKTESGEFVRETATYVERVVGTRKHKQNYSQPIVLADDFARLVDILDRHVDAKTRFGQSLDLPATLVDENHYGEAHYINRPWLQEAIRDFIDTHTSGYIIIAADALWGKTSFALDWRRRSRDGDASPLPPLAGAAFIRQMDGNKYVSPTAILEALEAETRFARNVPRSKTVASSSKDGIEDRDGILKKRFGIFLDDLAKSILIDKREAVLLLDGVDEIWGPSGIKPGNLLPGALDNMLPDGVFIVLLSRPGPHLRWEVSQPRSCLRIVLDDTKDDKDATRWRDLNRAHLAKTIEDRAKALERRNLPDDAESAALLRTFAAPLLEAAQNHLFVLTPILGTDDDLATNLREWRDHPDRLPKSHLDLVARVLERIRDALGRADQRNRRRGLDALQYPLQILACLAVAACLREAVPLPELRSLLFGRSNGERAGKRGIRRPETCGPLDWDMMNRKVFDSALRFGVDCFAGHKPEGLPRTNAFWHPQMREVVRAAWRIACRTTEWPNTDKIVAELARADESQAAAAERLLHHWIAAASSHFWPPHGSRQEETCDAGDYAVAQGPWHALQTVDAAAIDTTANALTDAAFLQKAYDLRGEYAYETLDIALDEVWEAHPSLKSRVLDVQRTLTLHDRHFAEKLDSNQPVLSVAAALYNDLCGRSGEQDIQWRRQIALSATASGSLLRQRPGAPSDFQIMCHLGNVSTFAVSPCGRWMALPNRNKIILVSFKNTRFRIKMFDMGGHGEKDHGRAPDHLVFSRQTASGKLYLASEAGRATYCFAIDAKSGEIYTEMTLLQGWRSKVNCVAFSEPVADGKMLYYASSTNRGTYLCAIDAENGVIHTEMKLLQGYSGKVNYVAFSESVADGKLLYLASATNRGTYLCVIDAQNGVIHTEMYLLQGYTGNVAQVAFSAPVADGKKLWLASATDAGTYLCSLNPGGDNFQAEMSLLEIRIYLGDSVGSFDTVAFSAPVSKGKRLLLASSSFCHVCLFSLDTMSGCQSSVLLSWPHYDYPVGSLFQIAFPPQGVDEMKLLLVGGSHTGVIAFVLDAEGNNLHSKGILLEGNTSGVRHIAFSGQTADRRLLLVSSSHDAVGCHTLDADSINHQVQLSQPPYLRHPATVRQVIMSGRAAAGKVYLAGILDNKAVDLYSFDAEGNKVEVKIDGQPTLPISEFTQVNFSVPFANGRKLWFASTTDEGIFISTIDTEENPPHLELTLLPGYTGIAHGITFSAPIADGKKFLLAIATNDGFFACAIDDASDLHRTQLNLIPVYEGQVMMATFSAPVENGDKLWLASVLDYFIPSEIALSVLDTKEHGCHAKTILLPSFPHSIKSIAFSAPVVDGTKLFLACATSHGVGLCTLDAKGDNRLAVMVPLNNLWGWYFNHVAFSLPVDNGQSIWLAGAADVCTAIGHQAVGLVCICSLATDGDNLHADVTLLLDHDAPAILVAFSIPTPSCTLMLASASEREVIIWCIPDGRLLARTSFAGTGERIHEIRWSDDSRLLYIAGSRGNVPVNLTLIVPERLFDECRPI